LHRRTSELRGCTKVARLGCEKSDEGRNKLREKTHPPGIKKAPVAFNPAQALCASGSYAYVDSFTHVQVAKDTQKARYQFLRTGLKSRLLGQKQLAELGRKAAHGKAHHIEVAPIDAFDQLATIALDSIRPSFIHWLPRRDIRRDFRLA